MFSRTFKRHCFRASKCKLTVFTYYYSRVFVCLVCLTVLSHCNKVLHGKTRMVWTVYTHILDLSSSRVKDNEPHAEARLTASCCATPCRHYSNLAVHCRSNSFLVSQAFSLSQCSLQLLLAVCCRPFRERSRAISVFSPYDEICIFQLCL